MNNQKIQNSYNYNNNVFGPLLQKNEPIKVKGEIKKCIRYDCKKILENNEDDIPEENEVYIKEKLLKNKIEDNSIL